MISDLVYFGPQGVGGTDGRERHPECSTAAAARNVEPGSPERQTSDTGWKPAGFVIAWKRLG